MKQTVVIFEGPDGCGKTHIAKELSKAIDVPYFKNTGEWANFEKDNDYFKNCMMYGDLGFFSQYLVQTGASVILDRSWPSELVYAKLFRQGKTSRHAISQLDKVYASLNTLIVIPVRSDYSGVVDQFSSITPEKLQQIEQEYRAFAAWTKCRTLIMNVDDEDIKREVCDILAKLET